MRKFKDIDLNYLQEYLVKFCNLAALHEKLGKDVHPNLPSLFSETLIKYVFSLDDVSRSEKCGDSKISLDRDEIYFEIKGTSSSKGITTIRQSKAEYIIWIYIDLNNKQLGIKIINFNCIFLEDKKQYNVTLGKEPFYEFKALLKPISIYELNKINKVELSEKFKFSIKKHHLVK